MGGWGRDCSPTSLPRGFTSPLRQAALPSNVLVPRASPGAKALRAHEVNSWGLGDSHQTPASLPREFTSPLRQAALPSNVLVPRASPGAKALRAHEVNSWGLGDAIERLLTGDWLVTRLCCPA